MKHLRGQPALETFPAAENYGISIQFATIGSMKNEREHLKYKVPLTSRGTAVIKWKVFVCGSSRTRHFSYTSFA